MVKDPGLLSGRLILVGPCRHVPQLLTSLFLLFHIRVTIHRLVDHWMCDLAPSILSSISYCRGFSGARISIQLVFLS